MSTQSSSPPPWLWVVGGCCLGLVALFVVIVALGGFAAFKAKRFAEEMEDPEARQAKALEVLNADSLPEGYYGQMGLSVPFVFEMAMLSDKPGGEQDGFEEQGFIYLKMLRMGQDDDKLRDFFEGKEADVDILRDQGINVELDERVGNGEFDSGDANVLWSAHRGEFSHENESHQGLTTVLYIDCPEDNRVRSGIWFGKEPEPLTPDDEVDFTGTVADGARIAQFVSHFRFCEES